jgi:hypothetical protein
MSYETSGGRIGPEMSRKVGTHAVFHVSSVALQTEHWKLSNWRAGAMDSVRL